MKLLLIALVFVAGCTPTRYYSWSSDVGKRCFYTCESNMWACGASCGPSWPCRASCDNAALYCRAACPDLKEVAELPH